jgi:hypothetical protein
VLDLGPFSGGRKEKAFSSSSAIEKKYYVTTNSNVVILRVKSDITLHEGTFYLLLQDC